MKLPVGEEPVLGKHLTDLFQLLRTQSSSLQMWLCEISNSGTSYLHPHVGVDSGSHTVRSVLMPRDASITNLTIKHPLAGTSPNRIVYTVCINGNETPLTVTVKCSDNAPYASRVKVPAKQYDRVAIRVTRPDGSIATAPPLILASFEVI